MIIDRFTAETQRLQTKFESGDKPTGKDFSDLITLFSDFYTDMVQGLTKISEEQIDVALESKYAMVDTVVKEITSAGIPIYIDLNKSKSYIINVASTPIATGLVFQNLPAVDKSTTVFIKLINTDGGVFGLSYMGISDSDWIKDDKLEGTEAGKTYIFSITCLGDTQKVITYETL